MADVQIVTVALSDGTTVQVVEGTPLHDLYLALAGFTTTTSGGLADIDLRTVRPMAWFMTPHGPQSVIEPATITEFRRRDYAEITAQQAADFFANAVEIPDVSFITGQELPAAMATAAADAGSPFAVAQGAASVAAVAASTIITDALADDTTVVAAAAAAVDGALVDASVLTGAEHRDPSITGLAWGVIASDGKLSEAVIGTDGRVPQWVLDGWKVRLGVAPAVVVLNIRPDGTGDYLSPKLANDAVLDSSPTKRYEIVVHPGVYTETEWTLKPYVTLRGTKRDACILAGSLPDSATDAQITNTSTIRIRDSAALSNLTITCKNMRYPVHCEADGANPDAVHTVDNCWIEHLSNDGARTWRTANPGSGMSASTVWSAEHAWGYGSASGVVEEFRDCVFSSYSTPWYVHNNKDFSKPNVNRLRNCRLIGRAPQATVTVQGLGSRQSDLLDLSGCEVDVLAVAESDTPWITTAALGQYANHADYRIVDSGPSMLGFVTTNRGKALRITSASTATGSSVRVSGTAVPVLFGSTYTRDGGGGLAGYLFGHWDISGILVGLNSDTTVANTLARRLGDRSSSALTLTVTINGSLTRTVTLNQNYTAATEGDILAAINTALAGDATADAYLVSQGENYPDFTGRQKTLINSGTVGIPRWAPVVYDANGRQVRLMVVADPVSAFVGVAVDRIPPGQYGRVLTRGLLRPEQFAGLSGQTVANGTAIYFSDTTDGLFALAGTRRAATGVYTNYAQFAATAA